MRAALDVEWLKLRRSRVVKVATAALLLAPCAVAAAFLAAAERGGRDAMSVKASALLVGEGWQAYLGALAQIFATGGLLGMGIVAGWCFGREFTDRTVVSLYASATPRERVAAAKLLLLTGWGVVVAIALGPVALAVGLAVGLGLPGADDLAAVGRVVALAAMTAPLALVVGLFASLGRGIMSALGGMLAVIVAAQLAVVAGLGGWFPWSAPGLWVVAVPGSGLEPVPGVLLLVVPLSALAVGLLTVGWWRRAELR